MFHTWVKHLGKTSSYFLQAAVSWCKTPSCLLLHETANSSTKIPEARVQLPKWQGKTVFACMCGRQFVQVWRNWLHTLQSHPILGELQGFSREALTNNNAKHPLTYHSCCCCSVPQLDPGGQLVHVILHNKCISWGERIVCDPFFFY